MAYNYTDRVALVTGASRGIGYEIAKGLASRGAHVVALARTVGGLEELDDEIRSIGGKATLIPFDLKKSEEILSLGPLLADKFGRLDIAVGNAAMLGSLTPVAHIKAKAWDEILTVNLTANHRLIATLDPLLRASDAGRATFVTSGVTQMESPYWAGYGITKAALEKMVETYASEVKLTPLKVTLLDPGVAATKMRGQAFPGEDQTTLPSPKDVADAFLEMMDEDGFDNGARLKAA